MPASADLFVLLRQDRLVTQAPPLWEALSLSQAPFWVWWLPPVLLTVVIVLVAALLRRERRPVDTVRSVEDYARFREALAQQAVPDGPAVKDQQATGGGTTAAGGSR